MVGRGLRGDGAGWEELGLSLPLTAVPTEMFGEIRWGQNNALVHEQQPLRLLPTDGWTLEGSG